MKELNNAFKMDHVNMRYDERSLQEPAINRIEEEYRREQANTVIEENIGPNMNDQARQNFSMLGKRQKVMKKSAKLIFIQREPQPKDSLDMPMKL